MSYRALAFDLDTSLEEDLKRTEGLVFSTTKSTSELYASVDNSAADLIVLSINMRKIKAAEFVTELRKHNTRIPVILIAADSNPAWQTVIDPLIELVRSPISPIELCWRIQHLMSRVRPAIQQPYETRVRVLTMPELRNKKTGRLDASLIAQNFGLSLADVARSVNRTKASVHKTPDAASLQANLYAFERIASAIKHMTGSLKRGLKLWLNAPNNAFPNELPVDIIKQGHVSLLANMLEDALLGHPD
jgi:DNA-binding response OmpR family regulator